MFKTYEYDWSCNVISGLVTAFLIVANRPGLVLSERVWSTSSLVEGSFSSLVFMWLSFCESQ